MSRVIIIRGPLAVGKSTVAKQLAKQLDAIYISIDKILEEHNLDIIEKGRIALKNFLQVNEYVLSEAKKALDKGKPVIFDGNFYYEEQILDIEERLKVKPQVFSLKASLDLCVQRDKNRKLSYGKRAAAEVYELVEELEVGIAIDTQGKAAAQVSDEILTFIQRKR